MSPAVILLEGEHRLAAQQEVVEVGDPHLQPGRPGQAVLPATLAAEQRVTLTGGQ